ncbi:Uncharacterized protein APZ42_025873, partial [Daphnia magna]
IFYGELCKLASSEIQKLLATYYLWIPSCFSIAHWELVKLKLPTMLTCSLLVISTEPVKFHEFVSRDECKGCGSEGRLFSAHSSSCLSSSVKSASYSSIFYCNDYQPPAQQSSFPFTLPANTRRSVPQNHYSLDCEPYVIQKIAGLKIFPVIEQRA